MLQYPRRALPIDMLVPLDTNHFFGLYCATYVKVIAAINASTSINNRFYDTVLVHLWCKANRTWNASKRHSTGICHSPTLSAPVVTLKKKALSVVWLFNREWLTYIPLPLRYPEVHQKSHLPMPVALQSR